MGKLLKSYIFWTYPRGSLHYDVMVTLILVFIFLSPHLLNYRDRPQRPLTSTSELLVKTSGGNRLTYDIGADQVPDTNDEAKLERELLDKMQAVSGNVQMDRYEARKDASGKVIAYHVWAHR